MARRATVLTLAVLIALLLVLALAPAAQAGTWSDVSDSLLASYGVTETQVRSISGGYPDGTFQPGKSITRAQFVKMADATFGITPAGPSLPTFADVPATHFYYAEIEAAYAAGLVNGVGEGLFGPERNLSREQAVAIIARRVATAQGFDLATLSEESISATLGAYPDGPLVSTPLRDEMAYALTKGITKGNAQGTLAPQAQIGRLAGATLLVRAGGGSTPTAPAISSLNPASGAIAGGTVVTITGSAFTGATAVTFGGVSATNFTVVSATRITATSPAHAAGKVDVRVTNAAGSSANTTADDFTYTGGSTTTPTITTWPSASAITLGQALSASTLSGGSASVSGTFAFTSPATIPAAAGSYPASVTFTPSDTVHYTTVTGTVSVTVNDSHTAAPTVSGLAPADGLVEGGTSVTITGNGFTGATAVRFGSVTATSFTVASDTQIVAVAPGTSLTAGTPSKTVNVSVTTTAGASGNTAADDYLYYTLTVKNGSNTHKYSLSDIKSSPAVTGYWGAHKEPEVVNQYTGTSALGLMGAVGGVPAGRGLRVTAADGFTCDYEAERIAAMSDGTYQMWDCGDNLATWADDTETTGSVIMALAYRMDGSPLSAFVGPVRVVLLQNNPRMVMEGKYSPYYITSIEVR
jgi:hypothetical protein